MKKLTGGILGILVGQFLVLSHKDKKFKTALKKKKGLEKIQYIFSSLFAFNKEVFHELEEKVEQIPLQEKRNDIILEAENSYLTLEEKVTTIQENVEKYSEKQLTTAIADIKEYYLEAKKLIDSITKKKEKSLLEKKLVAIKKHIDTIRASLKS